MLKPHLVTSVTKTRIWFAVGKKRDWRNVPLKTIKWRLR